MLEERLIAQARRDDEFEEVRLDALSKVRPLLILLDRQRRSWSGHLAYPDLKRREEIAAADPEAASAAGTYSNRFAAHIVHYPRLYALFKERGWQANFLGRHDGGYDGEARGVFAEGEWLSAGAQTRRDALERILPRTRISDRCELSDRFLLVRGELRSYKIHLGSANVLMAPDDAYLCIVPDRRGVGPAPGRGGGRDGRVFLPFEDDRLSVILSKAFLLADDTKIADETILRQIKGWR